MQVKAMLTSAVIFNECPQLPLAALRIVANDVEDGESSPSPVAWAKFISGEDNDI